MFFWYFWQESFGFLGIKSIVFFLFSLYFSWLLKFWVRIKISSRYYLTCCTSLPFSHFLMCYLTNQAALENVELHVVQLTEIFLTWVLSQALYCIISIYYWSNWTKFFFVFGYIIIICRPQMKVLIVKFKLLPRNTSISAISLTFFY